MDKILGSMSPSSEEDQFIHHQHVKHVNHKRRNKSMTDLEELQNLEQQEEYTTKKKEKKKKKRRKSKARNLSPLRMITRTRRSCSPVRFCTDDLGHSSPSSLLESFKDKLVLSGDGIPKKQSSLSKAALAMLVAKEFDDMEE
jgi:hypothetical protein